MPQRTDISSWLCHFCRRLPIGGPEDPLGVDGDHEEGSVEPDLVLEHILKQGVLAATWSRRNGRRTIWGPRPAVCFTEMPIEGLLTYAAERSDAFVAPFGIAVQRRDLFKRGGRPVIYGLSGKLRKQAERLLDPSVLPFAEQYRFVAYDPTRPKRLDWTHEREWRWPANPSERRWALDWNQDPVVRLGLALFDGSFKEVVAFAKTREWAMRVAGAVVRVADSGYSFSDYLVDKAVLQRSRVLALDRVRESLRDGDRRAATIETMPPGCFVPMTPPTPNDTDVRAAREALDRARKAAVGAAQAFAATNPGMQVGDIDAFVSVRCDDPFHLSLRALLTFDDVDADPDGYTILSIRGIDDPDMPPWTTASIQEAAARAAIAVFETELGLECYPRTVWD